MADAALVHTHARKNAGGNGRNACPPRLTERHAQQRARGTVQTAGAAAELFTDFMRAKALCVELQSLNQDAQLSQLPERKAQIHPNRVSETAQAVCTLSLELRDAAGQTVACDQFVDGEPSAKSAPFVRQLGGQAREYRV